MPETHQYRRHSTPFPNDFGLTQPVSTYSGGRGGRPPSRLEPDPYVRNTYNHRRKHRSHAGSRHRIPEDPGEDGPTSEALGMGSAGSGLDHVKLENPRLPGQRFRGNSSSVTNLSSRPPRYSSRTFMGSQEHLRLPGEQIRPISSAYSGSVDAIGPPGVPAFQAVTQPVYPEGEERAVGVGWSQRGSSARPPIGKPPLIVVGDAEEEAAVRSQRTKGSLFRSSSLNPQLPTNGQVKLKSDVGGAMATGSTHTNNSSSGSKSEEVDQEETPVTWEVIALLAIQLYNVSKKVE